MSSLNFLNSFIKAHPRLTPSQEDYLLRHFRYGYDTRMQLRKEKQRVTSLIENTPPGRSRMYYQSELKEIEQLLLKDPFIKKIDYYRNSLIEHNLKLVIKVASSYSGKGLPIDDLIQEGTLGFIRAIEKFDPREGVRLATYATWWIRQKITRALSNKTRIIRLPVHIAAEVTKVLKYIRTNELNLDSKHIDEISEATGISKKQVKMALMHINSFSPINQACINAPRDGDRSHEADQLSIQIDQHAPVFEAPAYDMQLELLRSDLNDSISKMEPLSQKLLAYKYGLGEEPENSYVALKRKLEREGVEIKTAKSAVQNSLHELIAIILEA